jgi:hypothetical protein
MKLLKLSLVLFFVTSLSGKVQSSDFDPVFGSLSLAKPEAPEVQWSQVSRWKSLGQRWAAALDGNGDVIAIYDLAYPNLLSQFPFGIIGGRNVKKSEIVEMIWNSKFDSDANQKLADRAINDLQSDSSQPIQEGALPNNWWVDVPWKNRAMARSGEPQSFRLSDINLAAASKKPAEFLSEIAKIEAVLNQAEGDGFGTGFLDKFQFVKTSAGTYQILWGVSGYRGISKPRKLADLKSAKVEFFRAMQLELAKQALDKALDLIPGTIVNALIDTAADRFFHFHKLVLRTHQNMFLEALVSAQDGTGPLSKLDLTSAERDRAIEALSFAQTSLLTSWKWIWKKPLNEWQDAVKKDQDKAQLGADWLNNHQMQFGLFNPRFGTSLDPANGHQKLLLMSRDKPNSKNGPMAAIDYSKPDGAYKQRLMIEISTAAVIFGSHFIPVVGSYVKKAFKEFVEKPVDTTKIWEGRLTVHLEERGQYPSELEVLDHQRLNPLFQNRVNMNDLISKRRQMIGL